MQSRGMQSAIGCHANPHSPCAALRHGGTPLYGAVALVVDERQFLERPANNRLCIQLQPVFQDAGVDAAEVLLGTRSPCDRSSAFIDGYSLYRPPLTASPMAKATPPAP